MERPLILRTLIACIALGASASALAWPERPVRILMPFAAGGASDVLTRILAENLQAKLGQPFVVENRVGAGGNIAMDAGAKAPPDGYTITSATIGTLTINQFLYKDLPFDAERGFAYASTFWANCNLVLVPASLPVKDLKELIVHLKSKPKGANFGSSGVGTTPHLAGELFRMRLGLEAVHVPARGGPQSVQLMLGGQLDFSIDNIANFAAPLAGGQVKALATTCGERWPRLPEVPTMAEAGVPDFVITSWGMLIFPAGTPAPIVERLSKTVAEIAADPGVPARFLNAGARITSSTPAEATAFAARERKRWSEVVRASGAQAN